MPKRAQVGVGSVGDDGPGLFPQFPPEQPDVQCSVGPIAGIESETGAGLVKKISMGADLAPGGGQRKGLPPSFRGRTVGIQKPHFIGLKIQLHTVVFQTVQAENSHDPASRARDGLQVIGVNFVPGQQPGMVQIKGGRLVNSGRRHPQVAIPDEGPMQSLSQLCFK